MIVAAVEDITRVINCSNGLAVVFKKDHLLKADLKKMVVQKDIVDGRYYDLVSSTDDKLNPAFSRYVEAMGEISNNKFISFPLRGSEGEFICTLQVESKNHMVKDNKTKKMRKSYIAFALIDRLVLNMIAVVLKLKL